MLATLTHFTAEGSVKIVDWSEETSDRDGSLHSLEIYDIT